MCRWGEYELAVRSAVGIKDRSVTLTVDGEPVDTVTVLASTGSWSNWSEAVFTRTLSAGTHRVRLSGTQNRGANIDHLQVTGAGPALPSLRFDVSSLSFTLAEGDGLSDARPVELTASDGQAVDVSLSADGGWVAVEPQFVVTPAAGIEVRADAAGLAPGRYDATLTASADGYRSARLPVSLTVSGTGGGGGDAEVYEAEAAQWGGGVVVNSRYAGYTGTGYVEFRGVSDLEWTVSVASAGEYELAVRYAVGIKDRSVALTVDGEPVDTVTVLASTGAWSNCR